MLRKMPKLLLKAFVKQQYRTYYFEFKFYFNCKAVVWVLTASKNRRNKKVELFQAFT